MPSKKLSSVYVLVIEDEKATREFLADQLISKGYKVMTADNGAEAVECVQNSRFQIVVSDVKMPGMDGIQTLEAIKKVAPETQVIMASGIEDDDMALEARKKGAYCFLQKPIVMQELFLLIEQALQLEPLLESVMDCVQELFHADECSFMLCDKDDSLYIACARGLSEEVVYSTTLKLGERMAGLAAKEGREYLITGGLEKYPEFRGIEKTPRILSSIVIPVYCQNKLLGVLNLNRTKALKNFTKEDLRGVSNFASQIAQAVQNAKRCEDLRSY